MLNKNVIILLSEIRTNQLTVPNYRLVIASFAVDRINRGRPLFTHKKAWLTQFEWSRHRQFEANAYYHGHGRLTVKRAVRANDACNSPRNRRTSYHYRTWPSTWCTLMSSRMTNIYRQSRTNSFLMHSIHHVLTTRFPTNRYSSPILLQFIRRLWNYYSRNFILIAKLYIKA